MSHEEEEATLSLPSVAIVAVIGFLIYRYFFASSSSSHTSSQPQRANGMRFTPAQVEQVVGMFPQLSRRDIMWDLQRNGGSVNATVERVLGGRGLDAAPPSFQPPVPQPTQSSSNPNSLSSLLSSATSKKPEPDLITRYNLQSRVSSSDKGKQRDSDLTSPNTPTSIGTSMGSTGKWSTTKEDRQKTLQQRRDEMILEARRKMMERDAQRGNMGS